MGTKKWYAVYTKPRSEKAVFKRLVESSFETYCPLNKVRKQWSDRIKTVYEPLFKSYVFVRATEQDLDLVRRVSGVVNFVYWLSKPAVIKDSDIERIKRFLQDYETVQVEPSGLKEFAPNTKVVVTGGVLMEKEGKIINEHKKRVELLIEGLDYKLVVFVDKEKLRVIND